MCQNDSNIDSDSDMISPAFTLKTTQASSFISSIPARQVRLAADDSLVARGQTDEAVDLTTPLANTSVHSAVDFDFTTSPNPAAPATPAGGERTKGMAMVARWA
ncbi:hypothetical protein EON64_12130 [archaeon]|nr:MAG: hypothetical protein EON64_12130 [archaeon]